MIPLILVSASSHFLVLHQGSPVLSRNSTTVSTAARADLAAGRSAYCYTVGSVSNRKLACLTMAEWHRVVKDARAFQLQDRLEGRAEVDQPNLGQFLQDNQDQ